MATSLNDGESLTISTTSTTSIVAKNKGHQFSKSCTSTKHQLTEEMMMDFCVFKTFKNINSGVVDNVRFMSDGGLAVTSASDDQINVFDTIRGSHLRTCHSKKYGCALATFTHSPSNILYASTKLDHDLRYLSLHDNKFLRFFSGHSDQVRNDKF
jgi:COMPASS component SWD2